MYSLGQTRSFTAHDATSFCGQRKGGKMWRSAAAEQKNWTDLEVLEAQRFKTIKQGKKARNRGQAKMGIFQSNEKRTIKNIWRKWARIRTISTSFSIYIHVVSYVGFSYENKITESMFSVTLDSFSYVDQKLTFKEFISEQWTTVPCFIFYLHQK